MRVRSTTWGPCTLVVILAIAVAITSTTGIGVGASWFDEQRITLVVVLALAALLALVLLPPLSDKAIALLAVAFTLGLLSSALAPRPYVAVVDWSVYLLMALLILSARTTQSSMVGTTAALTGAIVSAAYVPVSRRTTSRNCCWTFL